MKLSRTPIAGSLTLLLILASLLSTPAMQANTQIIADATSAATAVLNEDMTRKVEISIYRTKLLPKSPDYGCTC
jgi:hypothetical protein